jgi:hypothetical protein
MCLPVSHLFWVSSLAYTNLLGTKGYVVVSKDSAVEMSSCVGIGLSFSSRESDGHRCRENFEGLSQG